jgi:hypothetical protein
MHALSPATRIDSRRAGDGVRRSSFPCHSSLVMLVFITQCENVCSFAESPRKRPLP